MVVMERERMDFTPAEAVKYLREKRGIIMSVSALRQRRNRGTAKAEVTEGNRMSIWTKEELDRLPISPRTRVVDDESLN